MIWLQIKYFLFLPLEQVTQKGHNKWNMRCPVCGDSQKKSNLKRGWATEYKGHLHISCYNCGYSNSLEYFLRDFYPQFYDEYRKESFVEYKNIQPIIEKQPDIFETSLSKIPFQSIDSLPEDHFAFQELNRRMIPKKFYSDLYFADNYKKWNVENDYMSGYIPKSDNRIVIPIRNKNKKIIGMSGRALYDSPVKYLHTKFIEEEDLIYGIDKINKNKKILIVEGPIDSMFLPNSIAVSGAVSKIQNLEIDFIKSQLIVIADNEPRNKNTCDFMEKLLLNGYSVFIPPYGYNFKDINESIINGFTKIELCNMIARNIYSGLLGIAKLKLWRKV